MSSTRNKYQKSSILESDTLVIRIIRLLFFALIIGFLIYIYVLYEADKISTILKGAAESTSSGLAIAWSTIIKHPVPAILIILNNALFIYIGYAIGKRR
ncbi:hypothetical protein LCL98_15555 [Rossellomorea aquimaris]|nr:hypothetical protein [Rossellomorea aquimaris]